MSFVKVEYVAELLYCIVLDFTGKWPVNVNMHKLPVSVSKG